MKGGRPLWSLSGSLVLHGLALAAAVALVSRELPPPILIVELEEAVRVGEPAQPAAPSRADSLPSVVRRRARESVPPPAPMATRPVVSEPPLPTDPRLQRGYPASGAQPEPSAKPPSGEATEPGTPASVPGPERASDFLRTASGSGSGRIGAVQESATGGIPGSGLLAMVVPSGGSEGEEAGILAAAPSRGGEAGIPAEFGPYLARFRQRIQESLAYPLAARRRGLAGTVQLEVELLPSGQVGSVVVRSSSLHAILDEAAVDTVRGLSPLPFPPGAPPRPLRVRLPIVFELK